MDSSLKSQASSLLPSTHESFHAELWKLAEYEHACIVVEGSLRDLLEGRYPGGAHLNTLLGAIVSIGVD